MACSDEKGRGGVRGGGRKTVAYATKVLLGRRLAALYDG